jgi:hypothetical protein
LFGELLSQARPLALASAVGHVDDTPLPTPVVQLTLEQQAQKSRRVLMAFTQFSRGSASLLSDHVRSYFDVKPELHEALINPKQKVARLPLGGCGRACFVAHAYVS